MPSPETILKLTNVTLRYDSGAGAGPVSVLTGISLEVARGESLAINTNVRLGQKHTH